VRDHVQKLVNTISHKPLVENFTRIYNFGAAGQEHELVGSIGQR